MDVTKVLNRYQDTKAKIEQCDRRAEKLRTAAEIPGISFDDPIARRSGSERAAKREDLYLKLAEVDSYRLDLIGMALSDLKEITRIIDTLSDSEERHILYRRYIGGEKWEKIAETLNICRKSLWRKHKRALEKLTDLFISKEL